LTLNVLELGNEATNKKYSNEINDLEYSM
jgi:hypothetical protein